MTPLILVALLVLTACADLRLSAGVSIGAHGASRVPSISGGLPGGGRLSYSP
jgi:hypothetical protein